MRRPFEADGGRELADLRVLVVEAGVAVSRLLGRAQGRRRVALRGVRDGREALKALSADAYDAVVVDLPMMRRNAEDFYDRLLRANSGLAERVVFLAADLTDPETRRFLSQAGRPFLTKPVDGSELLDLLIRVAAPPAG